MIFIAVLCLVSVVLVVAIYRHSQIMTEEDFKEFERQWLRKSLRRAKP